MTAENRSCICKVLFILFLTVSVLLLAASASGEEPERFSSGNYDCSLLNDGTAEIIKYSGTESIIEIPAVIDGYTVTAIGNKAFQYCSHLTEVSIPDSVTSIGNSAFSFCKSLAGIIVGRDSYAKQYCIDNKLPFSYADSND